MLIDLFKGMGVTLRCLFQKPITVQYPEERREQYDRTRWRHRLLRWEDGLERCVGCSLCAAACPSHCIYVEAAENTETDRHSPGERYAKRYEINLLRCIFCGYCEDACPTGAIVLREQFELANYDRNAFLYTKEMLLEPLPAAAGGQARRHPAREPALEAAAR
ncbi:MAG: NADH-quinone oxidoreductase subunit NuoI [Nitrospirae bacterium]|nr:NADH-quinone oxidoreductase subunit NuoI [Nitrospirota bacterium]